MSQNAKKVAPAIFALAAISFLLPFVTVSCGGQRRTTVTGFDLATGTTVQQPGMFGRTQGQKVNAEPTAMLALIAAVFGCALGFVSGQVPAIVRTVIAGFGALMLLLLKASLDQQVTERGGGVVRVDYEFGFWLALVLMIGAAAFNGYLAAQKETGGSAIAAVPTAPPIARERASPPESAPTTACPQCGAPIGATSKFCGECGQPLSASAAAGENGLTAEAKDKLSRGLCPNCDAYNAWVTDRMGSIRTCEVCGKQYPLSI